MEGLQARRERQGFRARREVERFRARREMEGLRARRASERWRGSEPGERWTGSEPGERWTCRDRGSSFAIYGSRVIFQYERGVVSALPGAGLGCGCIVLRRPGLRACGRRTPCASPLTLMPE